MKATTEQLERLVKAAEVIAAWLSIELEKSVSDEWQLIHAPKAACLELIQASAIIETFLAASGEKMDAWLYQSMRDQQDQMPPRRFQEDV